MILILISLLANCISIHSLNEDSVVLRNVLGQNEYKPDESTCLPQDIRVKAFDIEFMTIETDPETIIFNGLLLPIKSCSSLILQPNNPNDDDHPSNGTILCLQMETLNHSHASLGMTDVLIYSLYNCTQDEDMTSCKYRETNETKPIALTSFLQSQIKEIDNTKHNYSIQQVYEIQHDLNEASCKAFNVSIFVASATIIIRSINDSNVTIEDPNGVVTALSVTSSEKMLYGISCPITGVWSICSNGIGLNISLIISTDFPFTTKFVEESLNEIASTTTLFACDVQTVVLDLKYLSLVSMNRDIQFSIMHSTDILSSTIIKQHNGVLYGSMKLPVHHKFFYQLSGIDIKGNRFTSSIGGYTLDLQYADIQFSLVGSQTILLNPGVKSLVRLLIRNNGKGPIVIPLLLQVNTSKTILVNFPKGHEVSIKPNTNYEHHVFLTPATDSPLELEYSTDVTFTVSSECIQENLSYSFQTVTRKPVDMVITNITQNSMLLHWEEPTLLSPVIHYLISFDFSNGTKATIQLDDQSILTYTVNGLLPNQLLYIGIIANTGVVNEFAGIIPRPVRTLPTVPESVASISHEIHSQFTASIFWSDPPSHDRILFYHITLYHNGRQNATIIITGLSNTHNLTDLLPFNQYLVTIKAENIVGIGASRNMTFYTKEGVPGMPVGLVATALLPTAMHVTWRPPPVEMRRGIITGYELSVSEHGNSTLQMITISSDVWSVIVSGLKVFSNATIVLSAVTSAGVGPAAIINVLLTNGVPTSPRNFQGAFINDTSVIFYWRAPRKPNGYILGYFFHLEWQNEDNNSRIMIEEISPILPVFGSNYHEYLIANMLPGEYKVYITAVNWLGNGTKSSTIFFEVVNSTNESDEVSFPTLFTLMFVLSFLVILSGVFLLSLLFCLLWKERKRVIKKVFQAGTRV